MEMYQALAHSFANYSPGLDNSGSWDLEFKTGSRLRKEWRNGNAMGFYIWYILWVKRKSEKLNKIAYVKAFINANVWLLLLWVLSLSINWKKRQQDIKYLNLKFIFWKNFSFSTFWWQPKCLNWDNCFIIGSSTYKYTGVSNRKTWRKIPKLYWRMCLLENTTEWS